MEIEKIVSWVVVQCWLFATFEVGLFVVPALASRFSSTTVFAVRQGRKTKTFNELTTSAPSLLFRSLRLVLFPTTRIYSINFQERPLRNIRWKPFELAVVDGLGGDHAQGPRFALLRRVVLRQECRFLVLHEGLDSGVEGTNWNGWVHIHDHLPHALGFATLVTQVFF